MDGILKGNKSGSKEISGAKGWQEKSGGSLTSPAALFSRIF
jgi:hypothetical protein